MAALPPPLDFRRHGGRAAEIGASVLGVLIATGVAAGFIVLVGARDSIASEGCLLPTDDRAEL
jgi:hypothetical protein